jgi:TonB family protein
MTGGLSWLLQASQSLRGLSAQGLALLLEATFKGTLFLLLAGVSTLALRRASAAARHLVWTLAMGALLILPIASLTVPAWKLPVLPSSPGGTAGEQTKITKGLALASTNHQVYANHVALRTASATFETAADSTWPGWILVLWAAGSMLWAARTAVGEMRVRRLARRSQLLETSQAKSNLEMVRRRLRINRAVELRSSPEIAIPFTRGPLHPAVLLPAEAHQWSRKQLESVLAHELAHVKRYDCLTQVPAQIACALFWFHPLVWLAAFETRKERERACDDIVLSLGHRASDYAEFLLVLSRSLRRLNGEWLTSVAMAQSSQLEVRMKAILDPQLNHRPLSARRVVFAAALAVALLLPVAAIHATAQNATGKIFGSVHDPSGAVVPGAHVTLVNIETLHSIVGRTGEDGGFEFPAIPAGRYRLEITKDGFAIAKSADLELKPSGDLHQDITLPIGNVTQEVIVHGHKSAENPPTPPPAPRRIRVGGLVQAAHLIRQAKPDYPASAQKQGIEGTVVLRAVIGTSGQILSLAPNSGPDPALIKAAMDAVSQWQYQPTLLNGVPVEVATTIEVTFQLDD